MSSFSTHLIPSTILSGFDKLLQGHLNIENIKIALGSGVQSNHNPQALLQERKEIDIVIESCTYIEDNYTLVFTIIIKPLNYEIKEIGLFYLADGQEVLIAYLKGENILSVDAESKAVLEVQLPAPPDKEIEITESTSFSPDIYIETSEEVGNIDVFFDDMQALQSPLVGAQKLNFSWDEVTKYEINFSHELTLIAFDRHPKAKQLLFLYQKKNTYDYFYNTYHLAKKAFKTPILVMRMSTKTNTLSDRYGIFGKIDNDYIRFYQSHATGVNCIGLSVSKDKTKKSYSGQQYQAAEVKDTATLYKLGNNAGLGGGDIIGSSGGLIGEGLPGGNAMSASGLVNEALQRLEPTPIIPDGRDNPLIDYIDDEEVIEVIGGNREEGTIEEESVEEETIEEETIEEEAIVEEIIEIEEQTSEETLAGITFKEAAIQQAATEGALEIVEEEILESTIVNTQQVQKYIIIKNKDTEKKIATKQSPIQKISVDGQLIKKENFDYFSDLKPEAMPDEIFTYESAADFNDFLRVNALTHMHCRIDNKIYIFSREMFRDENEAKFFVYDRSNKSINSYFLPEKIRKLVIDSNMINYTDAHVVARDKIIYFGLHVYSNTKLSIQIIKLEID